MSYLKTQCSGILLVLLTILLDISSAVIGPSHGKIVVCYVGTWAVYRPGRGSFAIEHIDPTLCTHIIYSFAGLNITHDGIRSLDPWQDLIEDYGKGGFNRIIELKDKYPHLKVSLAIGGWNEGSKNYSQLVSNPGRRSRFVANALEFIKKYKFDGLDLDWEFPGKRGGAPEDKVNFLLLVKELRTVFRKANLLLTAAFGAGKDTIDIAYDVEGLSFYLDFIHMMCYDYHGAWDQKTGANSPLRSTDVLNVEYTVQYMLKLGAPAEKLVLGIPLYGRTFHLTEPVLASVMRTPKLGSVARNFGFQGPYTRENGFMGYNEICVELKNTTAGWTEYWDDESRTPFAINGDKLITYDNERSVAEKIKFAMVKNLAGAMVWSLDTDDFHGDCSDETSTTYINFPLMRSINKAIEVSLEEIERDKENEIAHGVADEHKDNGGVNLGSSALVLVIISTVFLSTLSLN